MLDCGESQKEVIRPDFNRAIMIDLQGAKITSDYKPLNFLDWRAVLSFPETIWLTAEWYRTYYEQGPAPTYDLTRRQIEDYQSRAEVKDWHGQPHNRCPLRH